MGKSLTLNTNIASLSATRALERTTNELSSVYQRLSSGLRINKASDDAAGLAVVAGLDFSSRVANQGLRNVNDGISFLTIASSAVSQLTDITTRLQELAQQAANGSFNTTQRNALDNEAQSLSKEYTRITQTTKFNGVNIFGGSENGIQFQAGLGDLAAIFGTVGGAVGTGTYATGTSYNTGASISRVLSQDINGDGYADVINVGLGRVTFYLGDGNGSFTQVSSNTMTSFSIVNEVQLADINGDGISDLLIGGKVGTDGVVQTFIGQGNGSYSAGISISVGAIAGNYFSFDTGDIDNDGDIDIVTANTTRLSIFSGNGTGSFSLTSTISSSATITLNLDGEGGDETISSAYNLNLIDTNNDGTLDITYLGNYNPNTTIGNNTRLSLITYTNTTAGFSLADTISDFGVGFAGASTYVAHASGDLNNDGYADFVVRSYDGISSYSTAVLLGSSTGSYSVVTSSLMSSASNDITQLVIADFNGDGNADIMQDNGIYLLGQGNGTFNTQSTAHPNISGALGFAVNDINNDGVYDVISGGSTSNFRADIQNTRAGRGALIGFSLETVDSARQAITFLNTSLNNLTKQQGVIGAFESRLGSVVSTLASSRDQYTAASGRIKDADVASDSAHLVRLGILQQSGAAVLAQANLQPQLALSLLNIAQR